MCTASQKNNVRQSKTRLHSVHARRSSEFFWSLRTPPLTKNTPRHSRPRQKIPADYNFGITLCATRVPKYASGQLTAFKKALSGQTSTYLLQLPHMGKHAIFWARGFYTLLPFLDYIASSHGMCRPTTNTLSVTDIFPSHSNLSVSLPLGETRNLGPPRRGSRREAPVPNLKKKSFFFLLGFLLPLAEQTSNIVSSVICCLRNRVS